VELGGLDLSFILNKPLLKELISVILAVLSSVMVGGVIFSVSGADPLLAYSALITGALIGKHQIAETIVKTTPLLFASLGVALAFKSGLWNVGAEGQIVIGSLVAAWLGFSIMGLPTIIHILLTMIFSFLGGAMWALIPGILKAKANINEVLTTLMMNYIAYWISVYVIYWPLDDPLSYNPQTPHVLPSAMLPTLIPGTRAHAGILLAIVGAILLIIMKKSIFGYEIKVVGANPAAAKSAGINVPKIILTTMVISGGLAALGGMTEVIGRDLCLKLDATLGYGYLAVAIALVGNLNPIGVIFSSLFFGALVNGADVAYRVTRIPAVVAQAVAGLTMLFVLMKGPMLRFILKLLTWLKIGSRSGLS